MTREYNIGWDFSGNVGDPRKTSLKRLVEHKLGERAREVWPKILERYGDMIKQNGAEHGEDAALLDLYNTLAELGVSKDDFREVAHKLLEEGLIRQGVIDAMIQLKEQGARNIIVTKNLEEEVAEFARQINARAGLEVISGVVGVKGRYDTQGRLTGVEELIGDKDGYIYGTPRVLKRDAVQREIQGSPLEGYVTDTGDKDIREVANTAVVIRSSVPFHELDEYFQLSADPNTGNYQLKVMNDGAWN